MKWNRILSLVVASALAGCAGNAELVRSHSVSSRSDVVHEVASGTPIPRGFAELSVELSLKTHKLGAHTLSDLHGTPEYTLLVNVDGQAVRLQGKAVEENGSSAKLQQPDGGEGVRYLFHANLRLKPGPHALVVALPSDDVAVRREITLAEGSRNALVLEPVYGTSAGKGTAPFGGGANFREGVRTLWLILNGDTL